MASVLHAIDFAKHHPFVTPVLVGLGLCGMAVTGGLSSWSTQLLQFGLDGVRSLLATVVKVRQGPLDAAADSTLVLALVAASQIGVFKIVVSVCKALPSRHADQVHRESESTRD